MCAFVLLWPLYNNDMTVIEIHDRVIYISNNNMMRKNVKYYVILSYVLILCPTIIFINFMQFKIHT